jgi:hypothetical protein
LITLLLPRYLKKDKSPKLSYRFSLPKLIPERVDFLSSVYIYPVPGNLSPTMPRLIFKPSSRRHCNPTNEPQRSSIPERSFNPRYNMNQVFPTFISGNSYPRMPCLNSRPSINRHRNYLIDPQRFGTGERDVSRDFGESILSSDSNRFNLIRSNPIVPLLFTENNLSFTADGRNHGNFILPASHDETNLSAANTCPDDFRSAHAMQNHFPPLSSNLDNERLRMLSHINSRVCENNSVHSWANVVSNFTATDTNARKQMKKPTFAHHKTQKGHVKSIQWLNQDWKTQQKMRNNKIGLSHSERNVRPVKGCVPSVYKNVLQKRKEITPLFSSPPAVHSIPIVRRENRTSHTIATTGKNVLVNRQNVVSTSYNSNRSEQTKITLTSAKGNRFELFNTGESLSEDRVHLDNHQTINGMERLNKQAKTTSKQYKRVSNSNNHSRNVEGRRDHLPYHAFQAAKRMYVILKTTHHLDQYHDGHVPKQILKRTDELTNFPQPLAPNASLREKFHEIANAWSNSLCQIMTDHYKLLQRDNVQALELHGQIDNSDWNSATNLAIHWTKKNMRKISPDCIKESLRLIEAARRKNIDNNQLEKMITDDLLRILDDDNPGPSSSVAQSKKMELASNSFNITEKHNVDIDSTNSESDNDDPTVRNSSIAQSTQSNKMELPSNSFNSTDIDATNSESDNDRSTFSQPLQTTEETTEHQDGNNVILLRIGEKKKWKIPSDLPHKKLLITDENFSTPMTSDFFHVILQRGSVWDLNNVIRNSTLNPDTTLILIHLGYKSVSKSNLAYTQTVINKIKTSCPNTKVFVTKLIDLPGHDKTSEFNEFCKSKLSTLFLDVELEHTDATNCKTYSEELFRKWNSKLVNLN